MQIIRAYHFRFILCLTLFIIAIVYGWKKLSSKNAIANTVSQHLSRRSIINVQQKLAKARRNQACLILNETLLVNIAGRGIYTTEFQNLYSGQVKSVYDRYLDINHHVALLHDGEIWLPCGLSGKNVNNEKSMKYMLIVNIETGKVRRGPQLRYARGVCGSVIISKMIIDKKNITSIADDESQRIDIKTNRWTEDVICVIGGSIGQHDIGTITKHVDCYSQRARGWIVLPNLPIQLDHLVTYIYTRPFDNQTTRRAIPTEWHEDQVLVAVGGRATNYCDDRREIYAMSLSDGFWVLTTKMNKRRSAFGSCMFDNRYIIVAGGVSYCNDKGPKPIVWSEIEVCDMFTKKCHISKEHLHTRRFATTGCSSKEVCFICGGTMHGTENLNSCESFSKDTLLNVET